MTTQRKRRGIAAAIAAVLAVSGLIGYLNVGTASADESTCTPITGFEQPLCDADAEIPEDEELREALETDRDDAVFWTGRVNGTSVEQRAANFATGTTGTTLEQALLRADIVMPPFVDKRPEAEAVWRLASNLFAEQASGTAFVVMGPELRENNIFETLEFPALKNNPDIERVIRSTRRPRSAPICSSAARKATTATTSATTAPPSASSPAIRVNASTPPTPRREPP